MDKKIHFCWFGGDPIRQEVIEVINKWKEKLPDYEIIKWDESLFDIKKAPQYIRDAYNHQKRAFVTDYVRLYALYHHGGIYLDTDVEIVSNFDSIKDENLVFSLESIGFLCMGIIASKQYNPILKELMEYYNTLVFEKNGILNLTPNSKIIFDYLKQKYGIKYSNKIQKFEHFTILPRDYFSPKSYYTGKIKLTKNSMTIHHFEGSWKKRKLKDKLVSIFVFIFGERIYSFIQGIFKW